MTNKTTFAKKVWDNLSAINCNDHVEKKMNLSYLSWSWAWATLMEEFPQSFFEFREPVILSDGTVEVWVDLTIQDNEDKLTRTMWLPVMDHKNNAIKNPDARKLSDTRMRCLVKAMALAGLGHYIYAGEDIPQNAPLYTPAQKANIEATIQSNDPERFMDIKVGMSEEAWVDLYNSAEQGQKGKFKAACDALEKRYYELVDQYHADYAVCLQGNDIVGLRDLAEQMGEMLKTDVIKRLTPEEMHLREQMIEQAREYRKAG